MGIKVSVIVPVYNVSAYIGRCVRSVMEQTYDNVECVIVDDATPDDSITQCEQMIAAYEGPITFSILHHEKNRGLSAARNTGTDAATGDYIFYLDSDDEITNDCIEKLVRPVRNDATIEMVIGGFSRCSYGNLVPQKQQKKDVDSRETVRDFYFSRGGFYVNAWNKLVNRDFLHQHQIEFKEGVLWEDNLWTFFLLKHLNHIYMIPDATYIHYSHPLSIATGTDWEKKACHWKLVYGEIANHFTAGESGKEAKFYIKYFFFQMIRIQKSQEICEVSQPYLKALYDDHYIIEYLFYKIIALLSRFGLGRSFLHFTAKKVIRFHK